jgi:hypothetical protein
MAFVYILRSGSEDVFKIGHTRGDVEARIKNLATGNPHTLTRFDVIETDHCTLCETYLHRRLRTKRRGGEFFAVDPHELQQVIQEAREFISEYVPQQSEVEVLASGTSDERVIEPGEREWEMYRRLLDVRQALDELDLERNQLEMSLKLTIGTASGLLGIATWKTQEKVVLDAEALKVAEPDLYKRFQKTAHVRPFRLLTNRPEESD